MPYSGFDPDRRQRRLHRFRQIPVRILVPNVITLLALCAGMTGIRLALENRYELALGAIVFAAMLDAIDGRVARMIKGTSRFGAELDSLADFFNFGVAPGLILYFWGLNALGNLGWIAAMVFAICTALRLARFNVQIDDPLRPAWAGNFFTGVPAPLGAIVVLLPIYLSFLRVPVPVVLTFVFTLAIAGLMVSRLPVLSGKKIGTRVRARNGGAGHHRGGAADRLADQLSVGVAQLCFARVSRLAAARLVLLPPPSAGGRRGPRSSSGSIERSSGRARAARTRARRRTSRAAQLTMRRVVRVLADSGDRAPIDSVIMSSDQRRVQTAHLTGVKGTSIGVMLPEPVLLRNGDLLELDDGSFVDVVAEPEPLIEVRGNDLTHLARLAWHLGDRHVPVQVLANRLRMRRDAALEALLGSLGGRLTAIEAPFDPEGGAYATPAAQHDHHGHDHDHDHCGHDHHHHEHR